ncbi:MAG: antitermination regulator [Gordonia sp. (in: high G+C Gram-positive bacteria)]|nr:MAG: antitermination regulator [Gordonia sp. (in: high G+C Gram-positive bacteria)]
MQRLRVDAERNQHNSMFHKELAECALRLHGPWTGLTPDDVLREVRRAAVGLLPAVDYASVTLVSRQVRGRTNQIGPSFVDEDVSTRIDALHHEHGTGPCFDAVWQPRPLTVNAVTTETRWPALMAAVLEQTDIRSLMSIQLRAADQTLGALNLFAVEPSAFTCEIREDAVILATHAAIALSAADRLEHINRALESRDLIGQAKGMLMERFAIDAAQAFGVLRELSQDTNVPVVDICGRLVNADHPSTQHNDV